jgi:hypothetical protein
MVCYITTSDDLDIIMYLVMVCYITTSDALDIIMYRSHGMLYNN